MWPLPQFISSAFRVVLWNLVWRITTAFWTQHETGPSFFILVSWGHYREEMVPTTLEYPQLTKKQNYRAFLQLSPCPCDTPHDISKHKYENGAAEWPIICTQLRLSTGSGYRSGILTSFLKVALQNVEGKSARVLYQQNETFGVFFHELETFWYREDLVVCHQGVSYGEQWWKK